MVLVASAKQDSPREVASILDTAWAISRFLPGLDLGQISVTQGMPSFHEGTRCEVVFTRVDAYRRVGSSVPGEITIDPDFFALQTASGAALLAHEMYHQLQLQQDRNILSLYEVEDQRVQQDNLPPWANTFEYPAYLFEAVYYEIALRNGLPPGDHLPLLALPEGLSDEALMERLETIPLLDRA